LVLTQEGLIYNKGDFKLLCLLASCYALLGNKERALSGFRLAEQNLIPTKEKQQLALIDKLKRKAGLIDECTG